MMGTNKDKTPMTRAPRNRTIEVDDEEAGSLRAAISYRGGLDPFISSRLICGDSFSVLEGLATTAANSVDLVFADPPYNLTKRFGEQCFHERKTNDYEDWLVAWLTLIQPLLKRTASIYICGDWRSSAAIQRAGSKLFTLRNRITWEREKGRGARTNWKNAAEDIWFFTVGEDYVFNLDAVKQRRRVIAPYRQNGIAKDWDESSGFRDTHPSNIWTDISVPFWSMPENTDHPTQKPEKLLAKILLASSEPGDLVLDPFAGSGTTAVAAKKLDRRFIAIELDEGYCLIAAKRLRLAEADRSIQGFSDGVFWERNSAPTRKT